MKIKYKLKLIQLEPKISSRCKPTNHKMVVLSNLYLQDGEGSGGGVGCRACDVEIVA